MSAPIQILIVSDGKPGHENQSFGLAEAMSRRVPAEIHLLRVDLQKNPVARVRKAISESGRFSAADYVISAGHRTHLALLFLARKFVAKSIVLMKPGLPASWFDWCVAPEHDFKKLPSAKNLITSKGALNRVVSASGKKAGKLFLIGGESKTHGFDEAGLLKQIREIAGDESWQVADSRRTPAGFLETLNSQISGLEIFPHQQTEAGWLADKLASIEEVWVTEDSVSMIYEALTSGAKVGVLKMPRMKQDSRVIRGLEKLRAEGYFIGENNNLKVPLAEAERCAEIILEAEK